MFRKNKLPNNLLKGYLFLLIATIIWGAAGPIIKYTIDYIPPLTFLFLRFLIACVILLPYTIYEIQKVKVNPKDYFNLFLLGIFSQTSLSLIFLGLKYTTAIDNAVIGILGSLMAVVAGHYFFKDKLDKKIRFGLIVASIGTILVVLEPILSDSSNIEIKNRIFGNSLFLIFNLFWVVFIIWSKMSMGERSKLLKKSLSFVHLKPMRKTYPPALITALSMFVGLFTVAPLAVFEMMGGFGNIQSFNIMEIDPRGFTGLLYMALFSSLVAYLLHQKALEYVNVSDTSFFGYLAPIFTFPTAYFLLGEIPNSYVITGCVLIATGVYITEKANNSH
ncbi:DMT family transporter [Patescibacteria group bacterium]|nr:DMT family transporter [Patescibacteria group bacterium]